MAEDNLAVTILSKLNNASYEELDAKLNVYEVTYLNNYLQNIMIKLYLDGKIKDCPIEREIEIERKWEFLNNHFGE